MLLIAFVDERDGDLSPVRGATKPEVALAAAKKTRRDFIMVDIISSDVLLQRWRYSRVASA